MRKMKHKTQRTFSGRFVLKRCLQGISCIFVLFAVGYLFFWCMDPARFPIASVQVVGQKKYVSEVQIQEIVLSQIKGGFFRLNVSTLQQQLLSLPWMKRVDVRKVWPGQVVIRFEEHVPQAIWRSQGKNKGMFSVTGILFIPDKLDNIGIFPILEGPEGQAEFVLQQFMVMTKILAPLNWSITECVLAPRGAWHLRLSNGVTVMLGTNDIIARLQRFVSAYNKRLYERQDAMAYVDLRYTSGMAIGWKPG